MNTRFKFRVWDNEKEEWLGESESDVITYNGFSLFGECTLFQKVNIEKISKCTIEQFTGLKTKDGKEIYEGDIVVPKYLGERKFVIEWTTDSEYCGFVPREIGKPSPSSFVSWGDVEIIGNIHEGLSK